MSHDLNLIAELFSVPVDGRYPAVEAASYTAAQASSRMRGST